MENSLTKKVERLLAIEETEENESEIRELVCEVFSRSAELHELLCRESDPTADRRTLSCCLRKLRTLNNNKESALTCCEYSVVELDRLLESVCLCADVLLSQCGANVFFISRRAVVSCCPTLIIDAFLNLISNAVKFSGGPDIFAALTVKNRRCVISVTDEGGGAALPLTAKSGIKSVQNTARLHGGSLLFSSGLSGFSARLALSCEIHGEKPFAVPSFSSYLQNRFSPVHVGLCDCISEI